MHLNVVGGDCPGKTELHPEILDIARTFVEYESQARIEGKIQRARTDYEVTELWRVLQERARGRTSAKDITLFDSVRFAIEDFSALRYVRNTSAGSQHVTDIDLVAAPSDPKDLFGFRSRPGSHRLITGR